MPNTIFSSTYKSLFKPILFAIDAEYVHDQATKVGNVLGKSKTARNLIDSFFNYKDKRLNKCIAGVNFENPVGLAAGFDYNGDLAVILKHFGFGFNTVGTVTAKPYQGNTPPRMTRLPNSKALLVNKGFKSEGIDKILPKLNNPLLENTTFGVSIGSTNIPEVDTINKAIEDYLETFSKLKNSGYQKYYELNISCPNTALNESFFSPKNFDQLLDEVISLNLNKPIFVKMPNEASIEDTDSIVRIALSKGVNSFNFSNLVKDRRNAALDKKEVASIKDLKGNISGLPAKQNSSNLVKVFRNKYKSEINLVACGGIMSPEDAKQRLDDGADLIQLITGMIYEGPDLMKRINLYLAKT